MRCILVVSLVAASCAGGSPVPAEIVTGQELCAYCRMTIVSQATAAQVAAPREEPKMFDEIGCLRDYLAAVPLAQGAVVYVADHRTRAWVDARLALFTRTAVSTPMSSGLLAHADAASRDADPATRGGSAIPASAVLLSPEPSTRP